MSLRVELVVPFGICQSACGGDIADAVTSPAWKLLARPQRGDYDARAYRAMAALAIRRRETEWAVRVLMLLISACLPILARGGDHAGESFVLGAGVWFVLTIPANAYLAAAEPPKPEDGDRVLMRRRVVAAA